jgi:hypothetical protein
MADWFLNLDYKVQLAPWLVASFLLHTLAAQLIWRMGWFDNQAALSGEDHVSPGAPKSGAIRRLNQASLPWLEELIRFVYYLGIPFFAAVSGLLGADLMGISGTDWLPGAGAQGFLWTDWARGLGLAVVAILAMAVLWSISRFVSLRAGLVAVTPPTTDSRWRSALDALYTEIHWAFYRSGPILWLGSTYWGTFAGMALTLVEAGLNPASWWMLKSPGTAARPLFWVATAWTSTLLFVGTQNLWLTIGTHLILAIVLGRKVPHNQHYALPAARSVQ